MSDFKEDLKNEGEFDKATLRAELEDKFDFVRYVFTDIPGTSRHKLIPVRNAIKLVESSIYSGRLSGWTAREMTKFSSLAVPEVVILINVSAVTKSLPI